MILFQRLSLIQSHHKYKHIPIISGASRPLGTHRKLFLAGNEGKPYLSDDEIIKIVDFIKAQEETVYDDEIMEEYTVITEHISRR